MGLNISIVVPSLGRSELISRLVGSLTQTALRSYDVCFGFDPTGSFKSNLSVPDIFRGRAAAAPGMHEAIEAAVSIATGDWLIMVHDDMVFLPGWDDFSFGLDPDLMLCFELLDAQALTWPPAVMLEDAGAEAARRQAERSCRVRIGGPFFGTSLCHRSKWGSWPVWSGTKYWTHDMAWVMETHHRHPDLAFGWMPGNCLYHEIHGSVQHKTAIEPDDPDEFERRYGMSVLEATEQVYAHSRSLRGDIA